MTNLKSELTDEFINCFVKLPEKIKKRVLPSCFATTRNLDYWTDALATLNKG